MTFDQEDKMPDITDMRGYINALEEMSELRRLEGVDLDLEVGALTERAAEKEDPALLFSNFDGFPGGFRLISNVFRTCKRTGPAMGISPDLSGIDYLYAWRKKLAAYKPVPVQQVEGGPIFENQMAEHEVDLYKFPTPKWHDRDGLPIPARGFRGSTAARWRRHRSARPPAAGARRCFDAETPSGPPSPTW